MAGLLRGPGGDLLRGPGGGLTRDPGCCCAIEVIVCKASTMNRYRLSDSGGVSEIWSQSRSAESVGLAPSFGSGAVYQTSGGNYYTFDPANGASDGLFKSHSGGGNEMINQENDGYICRQRWASGSDRFITSFDPSGAETDFDADPISVGTDDWALRLDDNLYWSHSELIYKTPLGGAHTSHDIIETDGFIASGDKLYAIENVPFGAPGEKRIRSATTPTSPGTVVTEAQTVGHSGNVCGYSLFDGRIYWLGYDFGTAEIYQVWRYDIASDVLTLVLSGTWSGVLANGISTIAHGAIVVRDDTL